MLFSSLTFIIFFAFYFLLHILLPLRFRLSLIILGSCIFYGYWHPIYIWVPFLLLAIAFIGSIWIQKELNYKSKRIKLLFVLTAITTPLVVIKYANFLYADILGAFINLPPKEMSWKLPLGISFITFTLISYIVDVYNNKVRLEKSLSMLSGLVLFFPHLIAGPILRANQLLPQLHRQHEYHGFKAPQMLGLSLFSIGLLKKIVFADTLAKIVDYVYLQEHSNLTTIDYLLSIYGFSVQIFCDFSGYCDMAIGVALLLGIRLPENFKSPYKSTSITDFWNRWHITLSAWLRDYIYIPLGGNRVSYLKQVRNVFITMGIGGLWHGANWTFILWGLTHAIGISFVHTIRKFDPLKIASKSHNWLKIFLTFHFVAYCWILFRAPNIDTAFRIASGPITSELGSLKDIKRYTFEILLIIIFFILHKWDNRKSLQKVILKLPKKILWVSLLFIWLLVISFSQESSANFIYFDF